MAASTWFFWDGRKDCLWSRALGPLESEVEHGTTRMEAARLVASRLLPPAGTRVRRR